MLRWKKLDVVLRLFKRAVKDGSDKSLIIDRKMSSVIINSNAYSNLVLYSKKQRRKQGSYYKYLIVDIGRRKKVAIKNYFGPYFPVFCFGTGVGSMKEKIQGMKYLSEFLAAFPAFVNQHSR